MKETYKAIQITRPGLLEMVEKDLPEPGPGEVLIKVEACGICGADAGAIEGLEKGVEYPRVPGHEVVGTLYKTSEPLPAWLKPGQRVGVGRLGGHCNACEQCRLGHLTSVKTNRSPAAHVMGGMPNICWRGPRGWSPSQTIFHP